MIHSSVTKLEGRQLRRCVRVRLLEQGIHPIPHAPHVHANIIKTFISAAGKGRGAGHANEVAAFTFQALSAAQIMTVTERCK